MFYRFVIDFGYAQGINLVVLLGALMSCPPELGALPAVLFVCMGNICRSPTAEAVCRHKAQSRGIAVKLDSAGTHAYHCGETPDKRSIAAGKVRGYDFAGITARQVCHADFEQFDLILAADKQNLLALKQQCR
ncbi:hypothetical protein NFHSH190041_20700 [Shewanella sp. NFH-SH190041]|nr:hypothetical protein NFHSH190041_20700 [Shewanella sp. NFH-SH190041]